MLTRLQTMEGNLSRARSSLFTPMSDGSTPSPPIVRPATSLRESTIPLSSSQGHSRNLSETSSQNGLASPGFPQRSASALGAAGGYRQPLTSSRSADALGIGYGATSHRSPTTLDPMLETLSEDEGHNLSVALSVHPLLFSTSQLLDALLTHFSCLIRFLADCALCE